MNVGSPVHQLIAPEPEPALPLGPSAEPLVWIVAFWSCDRWKVTEVRNRLLHASGSWEQLLLSCWPEEQLGDDTEGRGRRGELENWGPAWPWL